MKTPEEIAQDIYDNCTGNWVAAIAAAIREDREAILKEVGRMAREITGDQLSIELTSLVMAARVLELENRAGQDKHQPG